MYDGDNLLCISGVPGECAAARADRTSDAFPPTAVPLGHTQD